MESVYWENYAQISKCFFAKMHLFYFPWTLWCILIYFRSSATSKIACLTQVKKPVRIGSLQFRQALRCQDVVLPEERLLPSLPRPASTYCEVKTPSNQPSAPLRRSVFLVVSPFRCHFYTLPCVSENLSLSLLGKYSKNSLLLSCPDFSAFLTL